MTHREGNAPPAAPHPGPNHPATAPPAPPNSDGPLDVPAMSLTLAPHRPLSDAPPADRARTWLACLFAGDFAFPAVAPVAPPPGPRGSAAEADALARALACRDLFVIAAGDDPTRLHLTDALARAARPGRVVVLAPHPDAADRLAERLDAVRAVGPGEPTDGRRTSAARVERSVREAADAVRAAEAELQSARAALDRLRALDAEAAALAARRSGLAAEVRAEGEREAGPTPFAHTLRAARAGADAAKAAVLADWNAVKRERTEKEATAAALRQQLACAGEGKKSGLFSRLFAKPKAAVPDPAEVDRQAAELERAVQELLAREKDLQTRFDAEAAHPGSVEAVIAAEIEARGTALEARRVALDAARAAVPPADVPACEARLADARARLEEFRDPDAARRFLATLSVVVGTPAALRHDPALDPDDPFALLVVHGAEHVSEDDFLASARNAERWVLVGSPAADPAGLLARVARWLDREPWATEPGRLVCRLAHLTPDQRRAVTREPLADRPEVELRFSANDAGEPILAEVAFPVNTPVTEAKSLLARELGECLLRPCGDRHRHESGDGVTVCWPAAEHPGEPCGWVRHGAGIREKVVGSGAAAFTAAVVFDRSAGWDVTSAEAWLADRLPTGSPSRFAAVPARPAYAAVG